MGMRCKKHPYQAGGGVCATCLRDRLLALAAERNGASSPPPAHAPPPPAPLLAFPRSVSPYVSRRKSDAAAAGRHHPSILFFRTPQVGPAGFSGGAFEEGDIGYEYEKRRAGKFSVLATLFGHHHRSEQDKHLRVAEDRKKHSWFAGIIPRRLRKKKAPASSTSPPSAPPRPSCRRVVSNRGLSPERDGSLGSGEESSSPAADPPWRPSPSPMRKTTPSRRRHTSSSMPSGFAVCLSPLVRPSPGRHHRPVQPPDPAAAFSCELRPSPLHNLAPAASVTRCRSRKLADCGRFR